MKHVALVITAVMAAALASSAISQDSGAGTQPSSIRVLSSNGVKAVIEELQADIERDIGRRLEIEFSTAASLTRTIEAGERFDVAILTPALIAELVAQSKVVADSRIEFARAGVGVGARSGSGVRSFQNETELKEMLLAAESVVYTGGGQSRATIDAAFEALGIADAMRAKTLLLGPGEAPAAVADGRAELVLTLVSEILPVPGIELVSALPTGLQHYVSFEAARAASASDARGADALLGYLAGPALAAALAAHGMEPAKP